MVCQVGSSPSPTRTPGIPLDAVQTKSGLRIAVHLGYTLRVSPSNLSNNLEPSHPLSPPVIFRDLGPVTSQRLFSLSPSSPHPSHQRAAKTCPCPFCVSMLTTKRERKKKPSLSTKIPCTLPTIKRMEMRERRRIGQ